MIKSISCIVIEITTEQFPNQNNSLHGPFFIKLIFEALFQLKKGFFFFLMKCRFIIIDCI